MGWSMGSDPDWRRLLRLSASRMTRLVDDLQPRALLTKMVSSTDARSNVAKLTPRGMAKLRVAWSVLGQRPIELFDHMDQAVVSVVASAISVSPR
jgi:DNA-binding MarR family transcriptional regulator